MIMSDIISRVSTKLHNNYDIPSQIDVKEGALFLYVNVPKFEAHVTNQVGKEPVCTYVVVDYVEGNGDEAIVHLTVLHQGPTRSLTVPINGIVTTTLAYTYRTRDGEEVRFFVSR
jgi:hypothetical protein